MLEILEEKLKKRFLSLSRQRTAENQHVHAIEHQLSVDETSALKIALQNDLESRREISEKHFFVWLVYAVEIGYEYNGDEYWQSFLTDLPSWKYYGDRYAIKYRFIQFNEQYNGFKPKGPWAEHFSIISWPISNAILPRSLQFQFAIFLYHNRFELAEKQNQSAEEIGQFASGLYDGESKPMKGILEQSKLTGDLVLNLHKQGINTDNLPISKSVFERLCQDIQKVDVKHYISGFRKTLQEAEFKVSRGLTPSNQSGWVKSSDLQEEPLRRYRPKLTSSRDSAGIWNLGLNLHGIAGYLVKMNLRLQPTVRVRIAGEEQWRPIAALYTYAEKRITKIKTFNAIIGKPVIQFDGEEDVVNKLKEISEGPPPQKSWLLRIQADGLAHEVISRHVRHQNKYLLLMEKRLSPSIAEKISAVGVECSLDGCFAYEIEIGEIIHDSVKNGLELLDIGCKHSIDVIPIGLVARWEDEETSAIWVNGEAVLLQLKSDLELDEYVIKVDAHPEMRIACNLDGNNIVELSELGVGTHKIEVKAVCKQSQEVLETEFFVSVRVRRHWSLSGNLAAGFNVDINPFTTSIENVLSGRSTIKVSGLDGQKCTISAVFLNHQDKEISKEPLCDFLLPVVLTQGSLALRKLGDCSSKDILENAATVELVFKVPGIGRSKIRFNNRLDPIRWRLDTSSESKTIRLIDEEDTTSEKNIWKANLIDPCCSIAISYEDAVNGQEVQSPGQLFVCETQGRKIIHIVTSRPKTKITDFSGLGIESPTFSSKINDSILDLLEFYKFWHLAKMTGPLSYIQKDRVIRAFELQFFKIFCSSNWVERMWKYAECDPATLLEQQKCVGGPEFRGFASQIRTKWQLWKEPDFENCNAFVDLAIRYGVTDDSDLARIAFFLAIQPHELDIKEFSDKDLLSLIKKNLVLWKGAFFAKTVVNSYKNQEQQSSEQ